jgi:signal peptide peptidase SppA
MPTNKPNDDDRPQTPPAADQTPPAAAEVPEWLADLDVPHAEQYFGVWAMREADFRAAADHAGIIDFKIHVPLAKSSALETDARDRFAYQVMPGGVAVIHATGPLMKYASSFSGGTSTAVLRRQIRNAANDEEVAAIILRIDSPGGTVAGTADLAADVRAAAKRKPTVAYIEDLGASAAYWLASQCREIFSNATALVGSIGTFAVVHDFSGAAAQEGIKVHVLRAGEHKGAGTPGTEITPEQLAEWQRLVDAHNEHFLSAVQKGRGISKTALSALADGRCHIGQAAVDLRLSDGVRTFDEVLFALRTDSKRKGNRAMTTDTTPPAANQEADAAPKAAAFDAIKAACPGADAAFLCAQLEAKATESQATAAWMAEQNKRIEAAKAETDQARAESGKPGVDPVGTGTGSTANESAGDAVERFDAAVAAKVGGGMKKARAIAAVVKADPDLHRAMLDEVNAGR